MADSAATPLKVIAGADSFGAELKDAMVAHLRSLNIEVEDLGITSYYNIGAEVGRRVSSATTSPSVETRGFLACGTGVGVGIFANKFPGVFATTCLTTDDARNNRSINNCNVLALSGMATPVDTAKEIVDTWLNTPFKSPCPASNSQPWSEDIAKFFDESMNEMPKIGASEKTEAETCAICCLVKNRELNPIDIIPGGSMKILRETPTSAIERYDLDVGDYLFTPAGDVHRVKYYEDTQFFIKWDGKWDMFFDEDLETAKAAIDKDLANGSA
ncbi:DRT102 protein [Hibiscus syriacus]|uniref:DRT102 protein n=1 Tax=Hibiscus syriacus TaxID=106335 RepID=A0A6A2YZ32_HIBSY|nr:DRT102 protein [Hibiscus syriacus]